MKKVLTFLVMFVFVMSVVMAQQGITVEVGETGATVTIVPDTVTFGETLPGTTDKPATSDPITITADEGNNLDIDIDITIEGALALFKNGLKFGVDLADGKDYDMDCEPNIVTSICEYTPIVINPTLTVPTGTPAGVQTGTIVYTITGEIPTL